MKKIFTTLILVIIGFSLFFSGQTVRATNKTIRVWVGAISEEKAVMDELAASFKEKTGVNVEVYQKLEIFTVPSTLVNNAELKNVLILFICKHQILVA